MSGIYRSRDTSLTTCQNMSSEYYMQISYQMKVEAYLIITDPRKIAMTETKTADIMTMTPGRVSETPLQKSLLQQRVNPTEFLTCVHVGAQDLA